MKRELKFVFSVIAMAVYSCALSQEDTIIKPRAKKWSLCFSGSPEYSYRTFSYQRPTATYNNTVIDNFKKYIDSLNFVETGKLAFTFGIGIEYKMSKHIWLATGIYLSDKGFKSKGFVYGNGYYAGSQVFRKDNYEKNNFYYYEMPFIFNYRFGDDERKLNFSVSSGPTIAINAFTQFYKSRRFTGVLNPQSESDYMILYALGGSFLRIGGVISFNTTVKLNDKISLSIDPIAKFYFAEYIASRGSSSVRIKEMPYSYGCNFRYMISF
jgi:hypothetical protein